MPSGCRAATTNRYHKSLLSLGLAGLSCYNNNDGKPSQALCNNTSQADELLCQLRNGSVRFDVGPGVEGSRITLFLNT